MSLTVPSVKLELFEYWWNQLPNHPYRVQFLLTKMVEAIAYKLSTTGKLALKQEQPTTAKSVFQLPPKLVKNQVKLDSQVAVVIPAKCCSVKDGDLLQRVISSLQNQPAYVIVVNDGSSYWPHLQPWVQVWTHSQSQGPAVARNTGIKAALELGVDFILFTDSDCIPSANWVSEAHRGFLENPYIHAISGRTDAASHTWFDRYHQINGTLNGRRFQDSNILLYGPTCNLAIARPVAESIQFDESFPHAAGEDIDFCVRMMVAGFRGVHRHSMVVAHDFQFQPGNFIGNLRKFLRQFWKYGSAEGRLLAKFPDYYAYFGQTEEIASDRHGI
ncbi:glycosyltransferase [Geitlerinema sp. PCC 9228]|uniref:glycosyltransferase n=1 Tax=Geitlerinema sp. PCC 9228 TaxID=111611 RepID=UPI0008F9B75D|nr:glycosyltransferase [Geitlerinema sp. PCC 9228]